MSGLFGTPASSSSIFGNTTQPKPNPFAKTAPATANPFGSTAATANPFGSGSASTNLFGATTTTTSQSAPSLFKLNTASSASQQGSSNFGNNTGNTQQGTGLFPSLLSRQQTQPQQQSGLGLFGSSNQPAQQQTNTGFGAFGSNASQQPQQQQAGTFGAGSSLFGGIGQNSQPQQQQVQQQQQQQSQLQGSILGQSQQNRIWTEQDLAPRQKSVTDQIELVYSKWDPQSQNSLFHTYLYNTVSVDAAPFYRPNRSDDEEKWEEALQKRPNPGAIPFIVKGFQQLGHRIISQEGHLKVLHGRLYEINNGLTDLLRRHDIDISTRTIECRRRHLQLSQKCLALATKVQVLRNRGYAMDPAEEGLRQKLILLEKTVFDPALNGRGEEIWARMVSVRERVRQLQIEFDKMGRGMTSQRKEVIDDEVMKRTKKILEDYDSQLLHLAKEVEKIKKEYTEWEESKPKSVGNDYGRGK